MVQYVNTLQPFGEFNNGNVNQVFFFHLTQFATGETRGNLADLGRVLPASRLLDRYWGQNQADSPVTPPQGSLQISPRFLK